MQTLRALPWFVSSVALLAVATGAGYVMWLDYDRQTSAVAETLSAQRAEIERLRTEVSALRTGAQADQTRISDLESLTRDSVTTGIKLSTRLNQTRRDVNDLWASLFTVADANRVSATFGRMNARIHDLAQATAQDVAALHTRIDATQKPPKIVQKPDVSVDTFLAQMNKGPATP
jgi:hypothetical protein